MSGVQPIHTPIFILIVLNVTDLMSMKSEVMMNIYEKLREHPLVFATAIGWRSTAIMCMTRSKKRGLIAYKTGTPLCRSGHIFTFKKQVSMLAENYCINWNNCIYYFQMHIGFVFSAAI